MLGPFRVNPNQCDSITDIGLLAVGDGCPNLKKINLSLCKCVTRDDRAALADMFQVGCDIFLKVSFDEVVHQALRVSGTCDCSTAFELAPPYAE